MREERDMIRVIYELDVVPRKEETLHRAWAAVAAAHGDGDGALGSVLCRDHAIEGRWVAISRWASRAAWESGRTDDAAPEAYADFRASCEVVSRRVLNEVGALP